MSAITELTQRLPRWIAPLAAALAGLILGLLIGWVWWPVQWTNASLDELSPAAQATYLSAVADAYVSDGDPNNALITRDKRLAPFGDRVTQAVVNAIAWHQMQAAPDNARINNLAVLAAELGAPIDASTLAAGAAPPLGPEIAPAVAAPAAASPVVDSPVAGAEGGGGAWRWLLGLFGAALLIGGGLWLFRRVWQQPEGSAPFAPVPLPANAGPVSSPAPLPTTRPAPTGPTSAWSTATVKPAGGAPVAPGDDLAFDSDDLNDDAEDDYDEEYDEEYDDAAYDGEYDDEDDEPQQRGPSGAIETEEELRAAPPAPRYGTTQAAPARSGVVGQPSPTAAVAPSSGGAPAATLSVRAAPPQPASQPLPQPAKPNLFSRLATAVAPRSAPAATAVAPAPAKGTPARVMPLQPAPAQPTPAAPGRTRVAAYTFDYTAGVQGYIDAANISDPQTREHIGEFGLGVASRNAALHQNPNQVIALEMWLVDNNQSDDDFSGHARLLLSDFAAGKEYSQALLKDRDPGVRTMMTRPGSRFTLEGRHLLLEALIESVEFDDQGIFRNVRVNTSVYRK